MTTPAAARPAQRLDIPTDRRDEHLRLLLHVASLPTASGKEDRVIRLIERWTNERPELALSRDASGNLTIRFAHERATPRPVYFTAHMDHPAFVVERILAPRALELSFRGGVMAEYFHSAKVVAYASDDAPVQGVLAGTAEASGPFQRYLFETDHSTKDLRVGDVATWDVGPSRVEANKAHCLGCDDLAALAAALAAYDELLRLRRAGESIPDVRLLFTRAEEVGFIGAIGAVRDGTIPKDARVIALENSRSFAESPIHAGPIVRVGDRVSVFSPRLTDAIATRAEQVAGGPASPTASQKLSDLPAWKWQRKLMAGGACEASVFFASGLEATCVCLPLGNYHNMADLDNVQAGTNTKPPTIAPEFIGVDDYHALVDLLIACGRDLPEGSGKVRAMIDKLWNERAGVLA